ncbi:hypothetical protein LCGC14_1261340 [marine sediment metagenome]|uniref:Uncharacterized protein n=1 Tax=marine sediment metagenome TaxID=412755 RepID=A0A0F9LLR5_9ZZZZ
MNTVRKHTGAIRRRGRGFSLTEVIVALGILAVALPMVATTFLAGALENKESVESTIGMMTAENALAVVRASVSHSSLVKWKPGAMAQPEEIPQSLLDRDNLLWQPNREADGSVPAGNVKPIRFGCVVVVQRLGSGGNDYRMVAVPFRRFQQGVTVEKVTVTFDSKGHVTKHEVKLTGSTVSADIGYLVVRTALRP